MAAAAIYCLIDPRSDDIRYVGYSRFLARRLTWHTNYDRSDTHKAAWISQLKRVGMTPECRVICWVEHWDAPRVECGVIHMLRARGVRLTNGTDGGDGLNNPTQWVREKISASCSKTANTPEQKAKRSRIMREAFARPEIRRKLGQAFKGKAFTADHRANVSAGIRAYIASTPVEQRRRRCQPRSAETKAAISAGLRRAWRLRKENEHGNT